MAVNGVASTAPDAAALLTSLDARYARPADYAAVVALTGTGIDTTGATDSTSALNALLASAGGKTARAIPGASYLISAPLVVKSGTTLDMTGATVTLAAGSNCNMLQNTSAVTSVRAVSDAAISSGSTTLTSATAAFTTADIGRTVVVAGAGNSASALYPLCAVITARTDASTVTLSVAAQATVSGATATLYTRDADITIVGGTWARGTNDGTGSAKHSLFLRRIDRLTIADLRITSGAGKYSIYPADITDLRVRDVALGCFSDGIHLQGPISQARITGVSGSSGDDSVAIGNSDFQFTDTFGSVVAVVVDGVNSVQVNSTAAVKLYGVAASGGTDGAVGAQGGAVFRDIIVRNVTIDGTTGPAVNVSPDVTIDDLLIDGVKVRSSSTSIVTIKSGSAGLVTVANCGSSALTGGNPLVVTTAAGASIARLNIRDCTHTTTSSNAAICSVLASSTVTRLLMTGCRLSQTVGTAGRLLRVDGTVTEAHVLACVADLGTSSGFISFGANGSVTDLHVTGCVSSQSSSGSFLQVSTSTSVLTRAWLMNNQVDATAFTVADLATTTTIYLLNHRGSSSNFLNLRATAVCVLNGDGPVDLAGSASTTAGYSLRINHRGVRIDASKITTQSAGDMVYNTNTTWASGTGTDKSGLYGYSGAAWVKVFGPA